MNEALLSNRLNTATNLIDNSAGYGLLEALMSEFWVLRVEANIWWNITSIAVVHDDVKTRLGLKYLNQLDHISMVYFSKSFQLAL